jgi:hypothetical protein
MAKIRKYYEFGRNILSKVTKLKNLNGIFILGGEK